MNQAGRLELALVTIFPDLFVSFLSSSLVHKAIEADLLRVHLEDIRKSAEPPHFSVDDTPYGGGAGMVMRPDVLSRAIQNAKENVPNSRVILMSASGPVFSQAKALELSRLNSLILVCGRYEGVDQRVIDDQIDEEISIGDFVVMGGEVPAMVITEATLRLRQGVLGNESSTLTESYQSHPDFGQLLEGPHYTRPQEFNGQKVPPVLLSGNHRLIEEWRLEEALKKTARLRPELLASSAKSSPAKPKG